MCFGIFNGTEETLLVVDLHFCNSFQKTTCLGVKHIIARRIPNFCQVKSGIVGKPLHEFCDRHFHSTQYSRDYASGVKVFD